MDVTTKALSGNGILAGNRDINCAAGEIKRSGNSIYLDVFFILGIDRLAVSIDSDRRRVSIKQGTRLESNVATGRQKDRAAAASTGVNGALHVDITCVGGEDKRVRRRATGHRKRTSADPEVARSGETAGVKLGVETREIGDRAGIQHERAAEIPGRSA